MKNNSGWEGFQLISHYLAFSIVFSVSRIVRSEFISFLKVLSNHRKLSQNKAIFCSLGTSKQYNASTEVLF